MEKWKKFELDCTEYLNEKYGNNFIHLGFSNSTISDIKYENKTKKFYIEVKMPLAQSGQFVLLPDYDKKKFIFSKRNKTKQNENVNFIIKYMNDNFEKYASVGTAGKNIEINQKIFSSWIKNKYKKNKVKFLITKSSNYIIFPIEKYEKYFYITAKYRIKKSGSSKVPKNEWNKIIERLNFININFVLTEDFKIKSNENLNKMKFIVENSEYMLSNYKDDIYVIRKLSNTRNANVIFKIQLLKDQDNEDLRTFINSL